ncbi:MAG: rihB [Acidimicrobiaceae bacterium]|nr:rihB [Acidimicrobiaceae bacterium]
MTEPVAHRIILDCDPGHDDALAILLAAGHPAIELACITTVAGNQTLAKTTHNACVVASVAGLDDVRVAPGAERPLLRELRTAPSFHGESGLDGPATIEPTVRPSDIHAVDLIIETLMDAPGETTLVATGPLTNVALALCKEPRIAQAAKEIVIMGGAYTRGNTTPAAEFNILVDPEAASIVFGASWRLTMMGLDVTHQALCSEGDQRGIAAIGSDVSEFACGLLDFFRTAYRDVAGMSDPPIHDACAVAYVADPTLFEVREAAVEVETHGKFTSGMTVVDFSGKGAPGERFVGTSLRRESFWEMTIDAITAIG